MTYSLAKLGGSSARNSNQWRESFTKDLALATRPVAKELAYRYINTNSVDSPWQIRKSARIMAVNL